MKDTGEMAIIGEKFTDANCHVAEAPNTPTWLPVNEQLDTRARGN